MKQILFVAGSDTEVGKTLISLGLGAWLQQQAMAYSFKKPAASGCAANQQPETCQDCQLLYQLNPKQRPTQITGWAFQQAVAPCIAARELGQSLTIQQLAEFSLQADDSLIVVEGAGGVCSPLASDGLNLDLIKQLHSLSQLQLVLVVSSVLGCLNHALMSLRVLATAAIEVHSLILSDRQNQPRALEQHRDWLGRFTDKPIFYLPYLADIDSLISAKRAEQVSQILIRQGWSLAIDTLVSSTKP